MSSSMHLFEVLGVILALHACLAPRATVARGASLKDEDLKLAASL